MSLFFLIKGSKYLRANDFGRMGARAVYLLAGQLFLIVPDWECEREQTAGTLGSITTPIITRATSQLSAIRACATTISELL